MPISLLLGDNREVLKTLADNSIDACVTDPPYELGFMGKAWDSKGIAYDQELWRQVLRVLKPGAHLLSFGGTRTYHRMACAVEDAGFEVRDQIQWIYGSGFPKSMNMGKAVDKAKGVEAPTHTDSWDGLGTALKPANEPLVLARKPLSEKTLVDNFIRWGTGVLNIDDCRVETKENLKGGAYSAGGRPAAMVGDQRSGKALGMFQPGAGPKQEYKAPSGRFPANVIHDGSDEVLEHFPEAPGQMANVSETAPSAKTSGIYGPMKRKGEASQDKSYAKDGGTNFSMKPGDRRLDKGSAARFFYCAKASKSDRNEGLSEPNRHPTVKPTALMQYLVRLVTPKGGLVLDPFMGSGPTGKACVLEGLAFVGIDQEREYVDMVRQRLGVK